MSFTLITRVMTLDLRSRRFGYVIFEGAGTILDWGIATHVGVEHSYLEQKLRNLLSSFGASLILVRQPVLDEKHKRELRSAFRSLHAFAERSPVPVHLIEDSSLRNFFTAIDKCNQHDIAAMIAAQFPELSWRLPPKRKPWQSQPRRQPLFDAASLGLFYFAQQSET